MSASITRSVVRKQLCAMGCELLDLGILHRDGRMLLREGWRTEQVDAALNWLMRKNARGAHIFVRPHGAHPLSLIDDLSAEATAAMKESGFQPALVVETSPDNFQAWLNHGRIIFDHLISTQAAKELARRFGGDPSSADWRHFGRLAGFTNQKPERRLESGLQPFVRLREYTGRLYIAAENFLLQVTALATETRREREVCAERLSQFGDAIRPLAEFHADPRYCGDLHRADMAWALHSASRGLTEEQIRNEILDARDLSKKGQSARQRDYAKRTAIKATTTIRQCR
ncbi:MAG: DNA-primase RepB domain-containing protein [Candidatus Binataceae bacterium]